MSFTNLPQTSVWNTSDKDLDDLWRRVVVTTLGDFRVMNLDQRLVTMGPTWLRDHVHELKGYKYFGLDMTSGLEFFFRHQLADGQFPDFYMPEGDQHVDFIAPAWRGHDPENHRMFLRVPVEADLEYLAVEGAYQAWKAGAGDEWLRRWMPALERGLAQLTSDRFRWSPEHQLVVRPLTPDTWDFTDFYSDDHFLTNCEIRRLDETTPLSVFHGDNSGLYSACRMMSEMYTVLGELERSGRWAEFGDGVQQRANALLWGDGFYVHHYPLESNPVRREEERGRLSLSNSYDINRGMPSHEQAVSIIDEFRRRWQEKRDTYMAEWFTIEPPYDHQIAFYKPGEYVNGGLFPTVGAELAKAAFAHGRERYAVDILRRYYAFIKDRRAPGFLFYPDGREFGGGPQGWCTAAFVSAMMEGLAGIADSGVGFAEVSLSPRWAAADVKEADVRAAFPACRRAFGYRYRATESGVEMDLSGDPERVSVHLLLPEGAQVEEVRMGGESVEFALRKVDDSVYLDARLPVPSGELRVTYRK